MKKTLLILFVAVVLLACVTPLAGLILAGPAAPAANEAQAAPPMLKNRDGSWNGDYLEDLSVYVGNGFWGRLECITGWNRLSAGLTGSTLTKDVILGKEGWLFYYSAAEEVSGESLLSDREIWCCARNLWLMQRYANEQGANFLFVAPNGKYDLYSEYMKPFVCLEEGRNVDRLQALLSEMGVCFADMYEPFMNEEEILYWHTDSHWNGKGAALAADAILAGLGRSGGWFEGEFIQTEPHFGDLYEMVYPKGKFREPEYVPAAGFSFEYLSNFRTVNDIVIATENKEAEGSLLMYRDSFARNLYPYLAERFATAEFSRVNNYDLSGVADKGITDVVVELGVKNIVYLLDYPAVYPSLERDIAVVEDCVPVDSELSIMTENSGLPGYARISGSIAGCPVDSPVYLRCDGLVFEAMPNAEGFLAYLDAGLGLENLEVLVMK